MKNKKVEQQKDAEENRQRLAEIRARRRAEPALERNEPQKVEKQIILIYCEGKNTEPSYFNKFKVKSASVKSFGEGKNTLSLVQRAKELVDVEERKKKGYDQVWCVFDADPKPGHPNQLQNFNDAIKLAENFGFQVAYSNQAFEYWLILHFEDHQGGRMKRDDYDKKLNTYLKDFDIVYEGKDTKIITDEFFELLKEIIKYDRSGEPITRTDIAIKRAEKIYNSLDHKSPGKEESSTTVYKLVAELLKYS